MLSDRDQARIEQKLRGAIDMLRKGASHAALLALNEAALILEQDVLEVDAVEGD